MSFPDNPNAYQSPAYVPREVKPGARRMQYLEMFWFWFQNPNWAMNLLWLSLCIIVGNIIPVVPCMVLLGYLYECIEAMHRRTVPAAGYPDFDVNRLMDYLVRGAWPMLIALVYGICIGTLLVPLWLGGLFVVFAMAANQADPVVLGLTIAALVGLWLLFAALVSLFATPMILRVGLSQEFAEGFRFGWVMNFVKTTWIELVLGTLFLWAASIVLSFAGLLLFCVGAIPAQALIVMGSAHMAWQLYEIFLERGGEPIPLKNPPGGVWPHGQYSAMR